MAYANHIRDKVGPQAQDVYLLTHATTQLDGTCLTGFLGVATIARGQT